MKILILLFSICFSFPSLEIIKRASKYSDSVYDDDGCNFLNSEKGELIYAENGDGARPKFCLWKKNDEMFLILRGSITLDEWIDNFDVKPVFDDVMMAYFHRGFLAQAKAVWSVVEDYVKQHRGVMYFTGHSRAASIAEIIHVYGKAMLEKKHRDEVEINFQTIAFAPPPTMSMEGEVQSCSPNITLFIHGDDIFPHLFIHQMSDALVSKISGLCLLVSLLSPDNVQCKAWMNRVEEIKEIMTNPVSDSDHAHDFRYIGGNKYWLKYDTPPPPAPSAAGEFEFSFSSNPAQSHPRIRKKTLEECKTTANELESASADLASLLRMDAFEDHSARHYAKYLSRLKGKGSAKGDGGSEKSPDL